MSGSFLKHLNVQRKRNVIVTAEDKDFDDFTIQQIKNEGFNVQYVPMGQDVGVRYANKLHAVANQMTGVSEHYAIIAYGDAASAVLEYHVKATPRLCALIAYYPSTIPDPSRTHFPMATSVLVHVTGEDITVQKTPEILGVQGKPRKIRRRIDRGIGLGGNLRLSYPAFKYEGVEPGFAEFDLEEFESSAEQLAWSRTLEVLREAFGVKVAIDDIRDQHSHDVNRNPRKALNNTSALAKVICAPTLSGANSPVELDRFYKDFFRPSPQELNARLLSRTKGVDRVVDEIHLSFKHDREIPWLLPGIPETNKYVSVILVSIVRIRGDVLAHEHVYWDQASVLLQIGLIEPNQVPLSFRQRGVKMLPVAGAESSAAIIGGPVCLNSQVKSR